jgi:hypothetical protein
MIMFLLVMLIAGNLTAEGKRLPEPDYGLQKQHGRHSGLLQGLKIDLPNGQSQNLHGAKNSPCRPPNKVAFMAYDPSWTRKG